MDDTPTPAHPGAANLAKGARPFDSDSARAAAARAAENRRQRREELDALRRERAQLEKALTRQADRVATLEAQAVDLRADAKAARAEAAALRRKLDAAAAAAAEKARRTPVPNQPPPDLAALLDGAAAGAVRTLGAVLRSLATATRTGELWRSGADAAALLDGVTRAAVAVQALADRAAAAPARRSSRPAGAPAVIEAGAVDIAALAESIRARASLPTASGAVSRDHAAPVRMTQGAELRELDELDEPTSPDELARLDDQADEHGRGPAAVDG